METAAQKIAQTNSKQDMPNACNRKINRERVFVPKQIKKESKYAETKEEHEEVDEIREQTSQITYELEIYDDYSFNKSCEEEKLIIDKEKSKSLKPKVVEEGEKQMELFGKRTIPKELNTTIPNDNIEENCKVQGKYDLNAKTTNETNNKKLEQEKQNTPIAFVDVNESRDALAKFTYVASQSQNSKAYTCCLCLKKFSHKHTLTRHMKNHPSQEGFKCETCCRYFNGTTLFSDHRKRRKYACQLCAKKYCSKGGLYWHRMKHKQGTVD